MEEIKESILNTKCNPKHCTLEYKIKKEDPTFEMSRADLLKRFVQEGEKVEDWMVPYSWLGEIELDEDAPQFTNWQAKYDEETARKLVDVKKNMQQSLQTGGVITKVLQTQFMLQLLMVNYLESVKKAKLRIKSDNTVAEEIGLPEMSAIFTEMMLSDRDCESLKEIRTILLKWRNRNI